MSKETSGKKSTKKGGKRNTRRVKRGTTKKHRGGVSKEMVDALRAAETQGRTDKENGVASRADAAAASLMAQYRLIDAGTPSPRTLLRDKYIASYDQTTTIQEDTFQSFLQSSGLASRFANLLS